MRPARLNRRFYLQDALPAGKALLGKKLVTRIDGVVTAGIITETEAYNGLEDRASHAYDGRRTKRTEVMFREGGVAYVYLCYGIHSLFNVVVGAEGHPQAVLIRAIKPVAGTAMMEKRRNTPFKGAAFTTGPGKVAQALGIHYSISGTSLLDGPVWIEDAQRVERPKILVTTRVGVDYAGPDALLPYRFILKI